MADHELGRLQTIVPVKVFSRHRSEYQEESEGGQCGGPNTRAHLACGYSLRRAPVSLLCSFSPAGLHRRLGRSHPLGGGVTGAGAGATIRGDLSRCRQRKKENRHAQLHDRLNDQEFCPPLGTTRREVHAQLHDRLKPTGLCPLTSSERQETRREVHAQLHDRLKQTRLCPLASNEEERGEVNAQLHDRLKATGLWSPVVTKRKKQGGQLCAASRLTDQCR
jgi:hypothetical protein